MALAIALAWLSASAAAAVDRPPRAITELGTVDAGEPLRRLQAVPGGEGFDAYLVGYRLDGLELRALVAEPRQTPPPRGFPILVACHGFHPDPPRYGITAAGVDHRPGDYYRPIPAAYAAAGFLVVMPDFRGHNSSEGSAYTRSALASAYYSEDVAALLPRLASLRNADTTQVFLWGHSMGAEVALRVALATSDAGAAARPALRGASLWSMVGGDFRERAFRQSLARTQAAGEPDHERRPKAALDQLERELADFGPSFDLALREPMQHLARLRVPLMIQHAVGDRSTDHAWSMRLAQELYRRGQRYSLHSLPGDDHFFHGEQLLEAVERDVRFFRQQVSESPR